MWIGIITIFPQMFSAITDYGVLGRGIKNDLIKLDFFNPRDFSDDKHQRVDERPYGGGPGMLMQPEPLAKAIQKAKASHPQAKVIYLSPQGEILSQQQVQPLCDLEEIILLCGRYEGVDERIIESLVDFELSIGDYVLSGGELPAMVLIDTIARFIPGILGKSDSALEDSFASGMLDCPHYTSPRIFNGMEVPEVLLSGNHQKIRQWRFLKSWLKTKQNRPQLLESLALTDEQKKWLKSSNLDI